MKKSLSVDFIVTSQEEEDVEITLTVRFSPRIGKPFEAEIRNVDSSPEIDLNIPQLRKAVMQAVNTRRAEYGKSSFEVFIDLIALISDALFASQIPERRLNNRI